MIYRRMNPAISDSRKNKRVAVAMSGGIDSSVAAVLLKEKGFDIIGVTLKLEEENKRITALLDQAREAADFLGIEHRIIDARDRFRELVVDNFKNAYLSGQTPNPCVRCNKFIKFGKLLDEAGNIGADLLATGHYARVCTSLDGKPELRRGADKIKDQSYFLYSLSPEQLGKMIFPLGGMQKEDVKRLARERKIPAAHKPESQDICFIPGGDYATWLKSRHPEGFKPGNIVDMEGNVLGKHKGIIHYTVGQRKGIGIGGGHTAENEPLYVVSIDASANRIVVGTKDMLACSHLTIKDCNWLVPDAPQRDIRVKFRSIMESVPATLEIRKPEKAVIFFKEPQSGISPGQSAVCYEGDQVIGGGLII